MELLDEQVASIPFPSRVAVQCTSIHCEPGYVPTSGLVNASSVVVYPSLSHGGAPICSDVPASLFDTHNSATPVSTLVEKAR